MIILILGLALWVVAHSFKRVAPGPREALESRLGGRTRLLFSAILLISVLLIVIGYRAAPYVPVYSPPGWGVHVVDLLMLVAIALFGLGSSKSPLRARLRHPQLWGFSLWCALHLLVNGDLAAIVMWGVLLIWALAEMPLINAREGAWTPYEGGSRAGTIRLALITLAVYAVVTAIHAWLGVWPFPR